MKTKSRSIQPHSDTHTHINFIIIIMFVSHDITSVFTVLLLLVIHVAWTRVSLTNNTNFRLHKPSFRRQPQPLQYGSPGEKIKFVCKIRGHSKLSVTWFKNSQILERKADPNNNSSRIKVSRNTLIMNPYKAKDAGNYSCRAETRNGHKLRSDFQVLTKNLSQAEPMKTDQRHNKSNESESDGKAPFWVRKDRSDLYFPAGSQLKLRCQADGNPVPKVIWKKGNRIKWEGQTMTMKKLAPKHEGEYQCIAENRHGRITHRYNLHVIRVSRQAPPIVKGVSNQTVAEGSIARFKCVVSSVSSPYIEWLKVSSVNTTGSTNIKQELFIEKHQATKLYVVWFVIQNVTASDTGRYICQASNASGRASMSAWLGLSNETSSNNDPNQPIMDELAETSHSSGYSTVQRWRKDRVGVMLAVAIMVVNMHAC